MDPQLAEIDARLRPLETYYLRDPWDWREFQGMSDEEQAVFVDKWMRFDRLHAELEGTLREIIRGLTREELVEAYEEGGRMLRFHIGAWMLHLMRQEFDPMLLPTLIEHIRRDGDGAYHMLAVLLWYFPHEEVAPLVLDVLRNGSRARNLRWALWAVEAWHLTEAIPLLEDLAERHPWMKDEAPALIEKLGDGAPED